MSLERIKQVMVKLDEPLLKETVTLTPQDIERLKKQPAANRVKLIKALGKFDSNASKVQDAHNDFFNQDHKPDVYIHDEGAQIVGDDQFRNLYSGIENEDDVKEFFGALETAVINATKDTSYRFHDVKVRNNGRISAYITYHSDTSFYTRNNEFELQVSKASSGKCKVDHIQMFWLVAADPNYNLNMYNLLKRQTRISVILSNIDEPTHTVTFK